MLPINFLKQLIGMYGNSMQNFVPQYLEAAMDAFQRNQSAASDAFSGNVFADMAKRNMAMFGDAAQAFTRKAKAESRRRATQRRRAAQGRACRAPGQSRPTEPLTIMRCSIAAALALIAATSLIHAQNGARSRAPPRRLPATGPTRATADGSEATFANANSAAAIVGALHSRNSARDHCQASGRCCAIRSKVWTSSQTRSVPSSFKPATGRLTSTASNMIPCSMRSRSSRGRIGVAPPAQPALVVPPGPKRAGDRGLPRLNPLARSEEVCRMFTALQVLRLAQQKLIFLSGFNAAKGGDPMSHGSARRSERGVRKL